MKVILCAGNMEAELLAKALLLHEENELFYTNDNGAICLHMAGMYPGRAYVAAKKIFAIYNKRTDVQFYNIGSCGGPKLDTVYYAGKIIGPDGKAYYPDLPKTQVDVCELRTVENAAKNEEIERANNAQNKERFQSLPVCFDMEASAIAQAASKAHISPSRVNFIKVVSDLGCSCPSYDVFDSTRMAARILYSMSKAADKLAALVLNDDVTLEDSAALPDVQELASKLKCSDTQTHQLERIMRYCNIAGKDASKFFGKLKSEGKIPPQSKAETNTIMREFRSFAIE